MTIALTGNQLRAGRLMAGFSREQVHERTGHSVATIYALEAGARQPGDTDIAQSLELFLTASGVEFARGGWVRHRCDRMPESVHDDLQSQLTAVLVSFARDLRLSQKPDNDCAARLLETIAEPRLRGWYPVILAALRAGLYYSIVEELDGWRALAALAKEPEEPKTDPHAEMRVMNTALAVIDAPPAPLPTCELDILWRKGWRKRVYNACFAVGYHSVRDLGVAYPSASHEQLARKLGLTVASLQVQALENHEYLKAGQLRAFAMRSLVRACRAAMPKGWGRGESPDVDKAAAFRIWVLSLGAHLETAAVTVWDQLCERVPPGWQPADIDDEHLRAAFVDLTDFDHPPAE